jgi:hypothetical protein
MAVRAQDSGYSDIILPAENARDAVLTEIGRQKTEGGSSTLSLRSSLFRSPCKSPLACRRILQDRSDLPVFRADLDSILNTHAPDELDFEDIMGQKHAKRDLRGPPQPALTMF